MHLRPYQERAVDAVYRYLRERNDNPCVVIPTGGGKTPVMATICGDAVTRWNGRVLILAHVKELLEQTAGTLRLLGGHSQATGVEVAFGARAEGYGTLNGNNYFENYGTNEVAEAGQRLTLRSSVTLQNFNVLRATNSGILRLEPVVCNSTNAAESTTGQIQAESGGVVEYDGTTVALGSLSGSGTVNLGSRFLNLGNEYHFSRLKLVLHHVANRIAPLQGLKGGRWTPPPGLRCARPGLLHYALLGLKGLNATSLAVRAERSDRAETPALKGRNTTARGAA